jgi:hypothetical protein
MRARAAGVNPNSVAYLTMSLAALLAVWTSGFCIALPLVVLIIKPLLSKSRSAIFASDASAVRQRPYAWQYAASGFSSTSVSRPM